MLRPVVYLMNDIDVSAFSVKDGVGNIRGYEIQVQLILGMALDMPFSAVH